MFNVVSIRFTFPRIGLIFRLLYPLLPMTIMIFIGFFLSFHFLGDTHYSARHTFDVLLRTLLLDIHPSTATQFHPVAARIVYFLFGFMSLYVFWGVGVVGIGLKVVLETDWHVEAVRARAAKLLRYAPVEKSFRRKRLLGRGKVISSMPFNVFEGIGIVFRIRWLRDVAVYLSLLPVVLGWSLVWGCIYMGLRIGKWMSFIAGKVMDEEDEELEADGDAESSEVSQILLSRDSTEGQL